GGLPTRAIVAGHSIARMGGARRRSGMIELSCGEVVLRIDAAGGGRIVSLSVSDVERILPRTKARAASPPLYCGCYPMVPWAGRLATGRISTCDAEVRLEPTLPPPAIHCFAFELPWDVLTGSATE